MHSGRIRSCHDETGRDNSQTDRSFENFGCEEFDRTNSADEVIGEVGLVLVVMLGIVVAINMALTALHIG